MSDIEVVEVEYETFAELMRQARYRKVIQ